MSANCTPEKKKCSVAVNYSPNMLKTIWSCWGRCRAGRSAFEWEMSSCSFWKWNSPSTGICLGILCSLLQVIAVMYQTCWFTIYKWLWCRIWEFMTVEVESDKSNKMFWISKQCNGMLGHLILSKWHQRTRRAKYFHQIHDLIKHFSQKKLISTNFLGWDPFSLK